MLEISIYTRVPKNSGAYVNAYDYGKSHNSFRYIRKRVNNNYYRELQPVDEKNELTGFGDIFAPYGNLP